MTFSILETPDWEVEAEMAGKFRNDFAFDERERLLRCECFAFFSLSLLNLPWYSAVGVLIQLRFSRFPRVYIPVTSCLWEAVYLVELFVF